MRDTLDQPDNFSEVPGFELDDEAWMARLRASTAPPGLGRFGAYELLEEIGRGGQGVIYRARQPGTSRDVAIKRIGAGVFSTPEMRARFDREIEAAAGLEHPNIVTVFGRDTVDGQPALLMQWVEGLPFDQWACPAGSSRDVCAILSTFSIVCDAVHHAHQRGVIHRDLKPSNILVDAADRPHVLDFGLAKMHSDDSSTGSLTLTGQFLGTPRFAAPEQLRGGAADVDIRTDVYALGVILYQSLTGTPLFPDDLPLADIMRLVQESDPAPPSALDRRLDRELDAIALKALAKEKERRYQSMDALAADVRRYLNGDAVMAHPPSRAYRLRKFTRQHRFAVVGSVLFLALLIGATTISSVLYVRAERQHHRADQERERAETALDKQTELNHASTSQWERAQVTAEFLRELFESSSGVTPGKDALTVRELLDRAGEKLERQAGQRDPVAEASLRMIIGNALRKLELHDRAEPHFTRALSLRRRVFGEENALVAESMDALGRLYRAQNRLAEAEPLIEGAYMQRRKLLSPQDGYLALAANSLGLLKTSVGKYDDAEAAFRDAIDRYTVAFSPENESIPVVMMNLAAVHSARGRTAEAEAVLRQSLELAMRIHRDLNNEDIAKVKLRLGQLLGENSDPAGETESLLREAAGTFERLYGNTHPLALKATEELAVHMFRNQRADEAEGLLHGAITLASSAQQWPDIVRLNTALGRGLLGRDRWSEAEDVYREAMKVAAEHLRTDAAESVTLAIRFSELLILRERFSEAQDCMLSTEAALGESSPVTSPLLRDTRMALVRLYEAWSVRDIDEQWKSRAAEWRATLELR